MDSLDELLADLHSATSTMKTDQRLSNSTRSSGSSGSLPSQAYQARIGTHVPSSNTNISNQITNRPMQYGSPYQTKPTTMAAGSFGSGDRLNSNQYRRNSDRYSGGSSGSGDIAPPLPPPPSRDVIEESNLAYDGSDEPLYEPQNIVMARINNQVSPRQHMQSQSREPAPAAPAASIQYSSPNTSVQSNLGANLNELDFLLQDLNSAQFMKDISRSGSDISVNSQPQSNNRGPPPAPLPKPTKKSASPKSPGVTFNTNVDISGFSGPGHASSATRELDELMDSLSQFKMNSNLAPSPALTPPQTSSPRLSDGVPQTGARDSVDDPSYAKVDKTPSNPTTPIAPAGPIKPPNSELDNMLGNLETDMIGHGVSVSTKGLCGACAKPIVGQVITALGKIWHLEHFCCQNCRDELGTKSFFERDEMPYCEPCYHRLFAPLCEKCHEPILDKCVTAMDTTWHMECFTCDHCARMLNDEGFHERDGRPYCREDYYEIFAPKCGGCSLPIIDDFISTLNTHWHTACFRCQECGCMLAGGSFFDHDGLPYCETHYYAKRGSLCAGCQKPITGRCITAMSQKFHPEHFTCAFCLKQLNKGTFKEQNDKPYCHPCFVKLFG